MNTTTQERRTDLGTEPSGSGVLLFLGVALVVLGLIALAATMTFTLGTVMLMGALLIAAAVAQFVHAGRTRGQRGVGLSVLEGIVYLIAGVLLLAYPVAAAISMTAVIGVFLLVAGVVRIVRAIQMRHARNWGWTLATGIADILLGVMILAGWPFTGLWVIGLFVGIELMLNGFACIGLALTAGKLTDRMV